MAGETAKSEAICLDIRAWSRTSHIVSWITPSGCLLTSIKGAVRPKSQFLGQYDLNYTCDLVYYLRSHGEVHVLRECAPLNLREWLRYDFRLAALASYFRFVVSEYAPHGSECREWYELLARSLDGSSMMTTSSQRLSAMITFDLAVFGLLGLKPDFSLHDSNVAIVEFQVAQGCFKSSLEPTENRICRVAREVAVYLENPSADEKNLAIPLDAARVISVFYSFHLDCALDVRRSVLGMIS